MADFSDAVVLTLQHEGGFTDNPADPGGATNMGIEQRDTPDTPIRTLTVAQATVYYYQHYWKQFYSQIISQPLANKLFDLGVLFGVGTAVGILQESLGLERDGAFDPETLATVNAQGIGAFPAYIKAMHAHVAALIAKNPALIEFAAGWSRRIDS